MNASITVVIPAHNASETLAETLDSILRQTRADWVAHIVDDASTDDTAQIAKKYCGRDQRFRLLQASAGSAGAARNYGASFAKTPWLAFLDADDLYHSEFLAAMVGRATQALEPERTLVYCWAQQMTPDRRIEPQYRPPHDEHLRHLRRTCIFFTGAIVMARAMFVNVGGYDTRLRTAEDWDLFVRLFRAEPNTLEVERSLLVYRLRPGSLVRTSSRMFYDAREVVLRAYGEDAEGHIAAEMEQTICLVGLWHLGVSIGSGQLDREFANDLPIPGQLDDGAAAAHLISGVATGACGLEEDWPQFWPRFRKEIADDLAILGAHRNGVLTVLERRAVTQPH